MRDRVPDDVVRRIQDEETPTDPSVDCGPHCHQGAVLEALIDELKGMRRDSRDRHRAVMLELSSVKGNVSDLQIQFARLAVEQVRTANTVGETASHQALTAEDAARHAPRRDSVAPARRRLSRAAYGLAAAVLTLIGSAVVAYAEAHK